MIFVVSINTLICFPACSPGRFGSFCTQTCSCSTNFICDRFTGDCVCDAGGDCKQGRDTQSAGFPVDRDKYLCFKFIKSLNSFFLTLLWDRVGCAVRQRHGSSSAWWEGVVGRHQRHRCARPPGGAAAGSPAALPPQAEGQAEHTRSVLLHQPHRQLRIRRSRYSNRSSRVNQRLRFGKKNNVVQIYKKQKSACSSLSAVAKSQKCTNNFLYWVRWRSIQNLFCIICQRCLLKW